MKRDENKAVILFDGTCNLCNGWVTFVLKRDPQQHFMFASLQSKAAQQLMKCFNVSLSNPDSIILIEGSTYFLKSTAALRIVKHLTGLWPILYACVIIPRSWRDRVYDVIAKNRYRWFGKVEQCMIGGPHIKNRFLADGKG